MGCPSPTAFCPLRLGTALFVRCRLFREGIQTLAFSHHDSPSQPPQPDVSVTSDATGVNVVISRDGKCTTHRGEGASRDGQVKDAVDKILADHRTAEYVKRG